jgi:hypothetical protein
MPRSDKGAKIQVITCPETGKIIKHKRMYGMKGGEANDKRVALGKTYNPVTRKHHKADDYKMKDERHSS